MAVVSGMAPPPHLPRLERAFWGGAAGEMRPTSEPARPGPLVDVQPRIAAPGRWPHRATMRWRRSTWRWRVPRSVGSRSPFGRSRSR